ncbi:cysteine-rich receptor-like protein kinase 14 [Camellia sinensis]|uniref:cysteine-rich receptor-like protein kinase 14 n=1 Tax=Camellia sinensis TaxID=4442 RepID=UPI001035A5BD|nr:cysteine-rich receptor-like protein kinase 14 [Camellia sinensis]
MDTHPAGFVWNVNNVSNNMDEFDWALISLVDSLVSKASMGSSRLKFASGNKNFTEYENIYALMMCTPDLSSGDCRDCLRGAVGDYQSCCNRKQTVDILKPSCVFLYKQYPFFESTADASPPLPPPPLAVFFAPPPLTPSMNTTTKEGLLWRAQGGKPMP